MSKKFNLDDYKGKYVMHCKTEEEAKDFCRVLHEAGRTWGAGNSYLEDAYWSDYMNNIYYMFNSGGWHDHLDDYYKDSTILEWSDFMNKGFTKDDLKTGDVLLFSNGSVRVCIKESGLFVGLSHADCDYICNYNMDLTNRADSDLNIIAVRRPKYVSSIAANAFDKGFGILVYERDETVEMTLEEVCKALGKNVKIVKEK